MAGLTQAAMWHRQAAALAAAADRVGVAEAELPAVRMRLLEQRARFADAIAGTSTPVPDLLPSPSEIAAAMPSLGDLSTTAVAGALAALGNTLDAADAALGLPARRRSAAQPAGGSAAEPTITSAVLPSITHPPAPPGGPGGPLPGVPGQPPSPVPAAEQAVSRRGIAGWRPGARNAVVYAGYAAGVTVIQALLFTLVDERTLALLAPCCLFVMPAFAWAAGWFTIGLAFRGGRDTPKTNGDTPKVNRTPRLGALVCLIPDALLCAGLGVLFLVDR